MADHHHHHHHHQHRPHRLSLPQRPTTPTTFSTTTTTAFSTTPTTATSRQYPVYPFSSTPIATPSKYRLSSLNPKPFNPNSSKSSLSFLFLLLLSLRSLYSLLPFLRSSPSFSLFPFSFLVSLLSFLLTLSSSLLTSSSSSKDPFHQKQNQPIFSLTLITQSQHRILVAKSILLAVVFLLRFQALRYCGTAAMILAELSGNVAARFLADGQDSSVGGDRNWSSKVRGFLALFSGLFLLSMSWDRIDCFPFSAKLVESLGLSLFPRVNCVRIWPMMLPFLAGFLGCYERVSMNWGTIRQLGRKRVRVISLFFTTVVLFIPAVVSFFMFEAEGDGVSMGTLIWPLANTVVFGVLLSESFSDDKSLSSNDFRREYMVTFLCTLVLELFYFPELSLWGLLLCGLLLYVAVRELDPYYLKYLELGMESSESFTTAIMKPIKHILSERKSRKIALFLMINTGYMFVEFAAGFMSNSLGLISDACHMLFDCAALAIGLYASYISRLPANNQYNYGRGRFEVLSGYTNAVFLVLVGLLIVLESFERILDPQEISTSSLLVVSIGGLLVNVVGLIFFHEEHHHAHGGSGSCSHSHHHPHSHDSLGHNHEGHGKHEECIPIFSEDQEKSCSGHHDQHHEHQHDSSVSSKDHNCGSKECHDHQHDQHDHHGHSKHDSHVHNHHHHHDGHCHDHDQHDHARQHHHHDHAHQHEHDDHAHQHEHHDHAHQHEHHDHAHTHGSLPHQVAESHIQEPGFHKKMELRLHLCIISLLLLSSKSTAIQSDDDPIISRFQRYLRINTAHPNPQYREAADFILSEAKSLSLESQTLEFVPGKPLVLLKWPGSDPSLHSVLLNSHTDVVPAEHDKWVHPPFSANLDSNGDVYARGSQDMKCVGMQYLEAIRRLKASGFKPKRSVYLSFVPDEEIGGHDGAVKLAESDVFKGLNVGIVLDEGLASPTETYRAFYAERRPIWLVIKATGAPGHGAKLYDNTAMENLLKSIESVRRFRAAQFDLVKAGLKAEGEVISVNMVFLKAGTPTPTGFVMNLQPSEAEAGFDIRVPPIADHESLEKRIAEEWAPTSRNMTFRLKQKVSVLDKSGKPILTATDSSNPWWALLEDAVKKANGKLGKPEIFPASTDAHYFRNLGLPAIGFSPMANTPILLHDHNEFLNKDEYLKGIDIYESIIKAYASYVDHGKIAGSRDEL